MWSVTRALNPVKKNAGRISRQPIWESRELNWERLSFPIEMKEISKFEKNNLGISVNVFGFEKNGYPLRISKVSKKEVDLLLIEKDGEKHFCVIKNLFRLLSSQLDNHQHENFICRRCLNHFSSQKKTFEALGALFAERLCKAGDEGRSCEIQKLQEERKSSFHDLR